MSRKRQGILGICFFVAICFLGAYRAGLLHHQRTTYSTAVPAATASTAPVKAAPSLPPSVELPKLVESAFPPSASTLDDNDPDTFIAFRYDQTHVLFRLGEKGDFSLEDPEQEKTFHPLARPVAEYGAVQPSELEPAVFDSLRQHYEPVHVGEQWQLEIFAGARLPITIQKPIAMSWGCANDSFTAGFIAEVAPEFQASFSVLAQKYFLVHKSPAASNSKVDFKPPATGEIADWKTTPALRAQIEEFVTAA